MIGRPVPLVIGDDWSLLLSIKTSAKQPVDLSGISLAIAIVRWDESATVNLDATTGRYSPVDLENGRFAVGLERAVTGSMLPDPDTRYSKLIVTLGKPDASFHTMAPLYLSIVKSVDLQNCGAIGISAIDPTTGNVLTFEGVSALVPTWFAPQLNFSMAPNSQYLPII